MRVYEFKTDPEQNDFDTKEIAPGSLATLDISHRLQKPILVMYVTNVVEPVYIDDAGEIGGMKDVTYVHYLTDQGTSFTWYI